jgi:hypothetical protein
MLTVELIEEGEVSPYLTSDVRPGGQIRNTRPHRRLFRLDCRDRRPAVPCRWRFRAPLMSMLRPGGGEKHDSGVFALFIAGVQRHHLSARVGSDGHARRAYGRLYADAPAAAGLERRRPQDRPQHACKRRPIGNGKAKNFHLRSDQPRRIDCPIVARARL